MGLAVLIVGIWIKITADKIRVIEGRNFTSVPVLIILLGLSVLIFGLIGATGGVFANTSFGRIVLFIVSLLHSNHAI